MDADEAIQAAIDAIGQGRPDDYVISPAGHAEELRPRAPALAAILDSPAVAQVAGEFESEDREALEAQSRFQRVGGRANLAVLAAGILISLVVATGALSVVLPAAAVKTLLVLFGLGSVAASGLASKDMYVAKQGELLEDWMARRAAAETARLRYFEGIVGSPAGTDAEGPPIDLLKLEYFRRYQLDVQRAYYGQRAKDHREEAAKTLACSAWAASGAAVAAGAAGILGASVNPAFAALGALGAAFAALTSFAAMREALNQSRRNAERYGRTRKMLDGLYGRLQEVREAVSKAGAKPLGEFVDAVHDQLSLEHRQWLDELAEARGAVARLDSTLKDLAGKAPPLPADSA